jgi:hypothetical protein
MHAVDLQHRLDEARRDLETAKSAKLAAEANSERDSKALKDCEERRAQDAEALRSCQRHESSEPSGAGDNAGPKKSIGADQPPAR